LKEYLFYKSIQTQGF